jgi:BirA family biotin operon repressor/biotin-[acetyl-CoA-carboxylase] ligase
MIRPIVGAGEALSQHSLEAAVAAAGIDAGPVWLDETGSTNDDALRLAEEGAPAWTVVAAGHQTTGRGRLGRSWVDVPGKALTFSVVLRPDIAPDRAQVLSLHAAVAVIAAGGPRLRAKWPNDVVIGDRKVAGILAEARAPGERLDHVVVGIGINVSMGPGELPPAATSLLVEGIAVDRRVLLEAILRELRREAAPEGIVEAYRRVCATLGRRVRARTTDGGEIEGLAADVDPRGALVVGAAAGSRTVSSGEVSHLR